jgi:hypothetical protein
MAQHRNDIIALEMGYRITKEGLIISPSGCIRKTTFNQKGYARATIWLGKRPNRKSVQIYAHVLQALTKFGIEATTNAECVRHLNGISSDNSWNNIEIGSFQENSLDVPREKRIARATAASHSRKRNSSQFTER